MLDLSPIVFEGGTIDVQTLGKDRVVFQECCETGLEDVHQRWLWHGCLELVEYRREVVPEVGKETLALEHEPFQIG